jgi:prepilin-type N-terminal cleavage/methylation domain-containing protein
MLRRQGFTLIEIIVVLMIIGIIIAFATLNFGGANEQAMALNAKNNLLAIYSAEQNYHNQSTPVSYCTTATVPTPCDSLKDINIVLSLNIVDDGTYTYSCAGTTCTATRNSTVTTGSMVLTLNVPTAIPGNGNPTCTLASTNAFIPANICP